MIVTLYFLLNFKTVIAEFYFVNFGSEQQKSSNLLVIHINYYKKHYSNYIKPPLSYYCTIKSYRSALLCLINYIAGGDDSLAKIKLIAELYYYLLSTI